MKIPNGLLIQLGRKVLLPNGLQPAAGAAACLTRRHHCRRPFSSSSSSSDQTPASDLFQLSDRVFSNHCTISNDVKLLCHRYINSQHTEKTSFLLKLASSHASDMDQCITAAKTFTETANSPGTNSPIKSLDVLRNSLVPAYVNLFDAILRITDGVKFLVDLRSDLLDTIWETDDLKEYQRIKSMEENLRSILSIAFSVGFLKLERITWSSPASLLEKIAAFEAVHPVINWLDLKTRVGHQRRCYAFIHPSLPDVPLVFVHVALTDSIHPAISNVIKMADVMINNNANNAPANPLLITPDDGSARSLQAEKSVYMLQPQKSTIREYPGPIAPSWPTGFSGDDASSEDLGEANTALFYSISSPQKGLTGIELGMSMIREVSRKISDELPNIKTFATLSPIPGFRDYLLDQIQEVMSGKVNKIDNFASEIELMSLENWMIDQKKTPTPPNVWHLLHDVIKSNSWIHEDDLAHRLQGPLMRKCAHYLFNEKKKGFAVNSVANFHMKNGAIMYRLNWRADLSPRGLANSCGIMINYRYYLDQYEVNGRRYQVDKVIPASESFQQILQHQV